MKAQTTVVATILGERHRKGLLAAINFFETKHVQNAIIYSAPWMEGAWKEMFRAFASSIETILRECKANEVTTQDEILAFIIATDLGIPFLGWQDFPAVQKKLETDIESEKQAVLDRLVDRVRQDGGTGRLGAGGTDDLQEDTLKACMAEEQRRKDSRRHGAGGDDDDMPEGMDIKTPVMPWNLPSDTEKNAYKRVCRLKGDKFSTITGTLAVEGGTKNGYACICCMCHELCPKSAGRMHDPSATLVGGLGLMRRADALGELE